MSKTDKDRASTVNRHRAQCPICSSPDRQEFEESFLNWSSPTEWFRSYHFAPHTVYRHAHQFGLFERRRENLSMALEKMVERMDWTELTGSNGIAAIKMLMALEEKKHNREQANLTKSQDSSEPKPAEPAETEGVWTNTSSRVAAMESDEAGKTASPDTETGMNSLVPSMEVLVKAGVAGDFISDDGQNSNLTSAVEAKGTSDAPVVEPDAEPVEA